MDMHKQVVEFVFPHAKTRTHEAEVKAQLLKELRASPWLLRALTNMVTDAQSPGSRCRGRPTSD